MATRIFIITLYVSLVFLHSITHRIIVAQPITNNAILDITVDNTRECSVEVSVIFPEQLTQHLWSIVLPFGITPNQEIRTNTNVRAVSVYGVIKKPV
jgi:hypothetical protein